MKVIGAQFATEGSLGLCQPESRLRIQAIRPVSQRVTRPVSAECEECVSCVGCEPPSDGEACECVSCGVPTCE